jgi:hypothetical protein
MDYMEVHSTVVETITYCLECGVNGVNKFLGKVYLNFLRILNLCA